MCEKTPLPTGWHKFVCCQLAYLNDSPVLSVHETTVECFSARLLSPYFWYRYYASICNESIRIVLPECLGFHFAVDQHFLAAFLIFLLCWHLTRCFGMNKSDLMSIFESLISDLLTGNGLKHN
jgi:hypothetical protein